MSVTYTRPLSLKSPQMNGDDVKEVQKRLNSLGYSVGSVDGYFGQNSDTAVRAFQKANELTVDGSVGPGTWNKLFSSSAKPNKTRALYLTSPQMYGYDVKQVQSRLNAIAYNCGAVDGYFGISTDASVSRFQEVNGLTVDGSVGPATREKLFSTNAKPNISSSNGYERALYLTSPQMYGDDIKYVQNKLNSLGYNCGEANGYFGQNTKNAVMNMQAKNYLDVDGSVGPATWKILFSSSVISNFGTSNGYKRALYLTSPQMNGDDVILLQKRLNKLGFNCGDANGYFGPNTKSAVEAFQRANNLDIDGSAGPVTWGVLFSHRPNTGGSSEQWTRALYYTSPQMYGEDIKKVQKRLNTLDFNCGNANGYFGPNTDAAVRSFQGANGLDVDGSVGPATWGKLFSTSASTGSGSMTGYKRPLYLTSPQMYGDDVKQVQNQLNEYRYNCGTVDGYFGSASDLAVRLFQKRNGLDVDGSVGPATWSKLFGTYAVPNTDLGHTNSGVTGKLKKIYIDAGHGGSDPGASGFGLNEKDVTLKISNYQKELFEKLGYTVRMCRTTDKTLSLAQRTSDANSWGADLYISNHCNASGAGADGSETYYSVYGGDGKVYAQNVASKLSQVFRNRGAKTRANSSGGDYYHVIRETNMPSIIIEHGFIDNSSDNSKLKSDATLKRIAELDVQGITGSNISSGGSSDTSSSDYTRPLYLKSPEMYGEDVRSVQKRLNNLGYNCGTANAYFGPNTKNAVIEFQKRNGLEADGSVGPLTWSKLFSSSANKNENPSEIISKKMKALFSLFGVEITNPKVGFEETRRIKTPIEATLVFEGKMKATVGTGILEFENRVPKISKPLKYIIEKCEWSSVITKCNTLVKNAGSIIGEGRVKVGSVTDSEHGLGVCFEIEQDLGKIDGYLSETICTSLSIYPIKENKKLKELMDKVNDLSSAIKNAVLLFVGIALVVVVIGGTAIGISQIITWLIGLLPFIPAIVSENEDI